MTGRTGPLRADRPRAVADGARRYGLHADLVRRLRSDADPREKRCDPATLVALSRLWGHRGWTGARMAPDPEESGDALCSPLFDCSTPHGDAPLIGLAGRVLDHGDRLDEPYTLEEALQREARHEAELRELTTRRG
ncbi:hypothetical protein E0L36_08485 [Streptomyces sp. AJS327]|uniref:hypothetical protein n=1 Tax=Streptomyces sp. AJS327 TaxID=2545265 RepID=UPI0015DF9676|nr:hypothetical protein [Streptomyces sp. AJS327]MBA0050929.1 hypothetical protein [Streptomyces sp. AJS327]